MPTYHIDYDDNSNWARIGALRPSGRCRVTVKKEGSPSEPAIVATGTLGEDGVFTVLVEGNGKDDSFENSFESVINTLNVYRDRRIK